MALCQICNQSEATKFNHYGATNTCVSCRAFFMRSVKNKFYKSFQCKSLGKTLCVIESKGRRSCKKCRFDKCLEVGMKISYVLEKQDQCKQIMVQSKASPKIVLTEPFTSDEQNYIEGLFETFRGMSYKKVAEIYLANLNLMHHQMGQCHVGRVLTYEEMKDIESFDKYVVAGSMTGLIKLLGLQNTDDINVLIGNSWHRVENMYLSLAFFGSVESTQRWKDEFFNYGQEHPGQDPIIDQLAIEIDDMNLRAAEESGKCNGCFRYESAYTSPWTSDYFNEERHKEILKECMMWLCSGDPEAHGDLILIILLSLILLLDTNGISDRLKYKEHIDSMQAHYADLLWKYLKFKHGYKASALFHKALMFSNTLQEAYEITQKRLPI